MMRRPSAMVTGAALSSVVALGLVLPTSALGDAPKKTFTVTLAVTDGGVAVTGPLAPAHTYGFAFTLTNGAKSPQAFGSAHIAVPTGYQADTPAVAAGPATFHLVVSGSTLALTNSGPTGSGVVPGSAITLTAHVTTPAADACQATPATWTTQVKQSNDFSGNGNDFNLVGSQPATSVTGATHLAFTVQPSTTEYDVAMTPAPVVAAKDGCGNTVTTFNGSVTLTDAATQLATGSSATASSGVATFSNLTFADFDFDDTLTASATGLDPATSDTFSVVQLLKTCAAGSTCSSGTLSDRLSTTRAAITADAAGSTDVLTVSVKGSPAGQFPACDATGETAYGSVVTLNVTNRGKTVTMTLPKSYVLLQPTPNGTPFWDICLSIPAAQQSAGNSFTDKFGVTGVYEGLLPDCKSPAVAPCVLSRNKNAGNEVIRFVLKPGDPHTSWY